MLKMPFLLLSPSPRPLLLARTLLCVACATVLAGCAVPAANPELPAASPLQTSPLPAYVEPASRPAAAPVVAEPPVAAPTTPTIIYGNDQLLRRGEPAKPVTGPAVSFKFEDAPAGEVVHVVLRDILKVDYVVYPPLNGAITLSTRGNISVDKALLLLESALQVNGIVMARDSRGTYHVGQPEALRGIVAAPRVAGNGPLAPGYGAIVFPLEYLGATEMAAILQPMVPADAIVRVDSVRNILVMRGTRAQAEGWTEIINMFDVNMLRGMSVGVFPLKHTSAAEVQAALQLLSGSVGGAPATPGAAPATPVAPAARTGRAGAVGAPGTPAAAAAAAVGANALGPGSPLFGALRILPIERINAVLVVTPRAAYLDEARYWIEQFDRPNLSSAEPQLFVYKVQNGSADHLAELLNGIFGSGVQTTATGATGVAPGLTQLSGISNNINNNRMGTFGTANRTGGIGGFGAGTSAGGGLLGGMRAQQQAQQAGGNLTTVTLGDAVRVMADRINNTLLIHATPAAYQQIETTLKRLDITRAQILIEASIIEVTLGDGLEYGLQWAFKNGSLGGGRSGIGALSSGSTLGGASVDASGNLTGLAQGFSYTLRGAGGNVAALLQALASKSLVKVISSPSLMVLDNHTAAIAVGNQQPIRTGDTITTGNVLVSNNIQYKDTGVMLDVTPSVNSGDLVTLDINQAVTDVGPQDTVTSQRTFLQRQINSKVAVRSGETLVLGGLIKDNTTASRSGLPILSSIPLVGALFGSHNKTNDRTELLVVLTPRVLRSDEDIRAVSRELRDRMQGLTRTELEGALGTPRP